MTWRTPFSYWRRAAAPPPHVSEVPSTEGSTSRLEATTMRPLLHEGKPPNETAQSFISRCRERVGNARLHSCRSSTKRRRHGAALPRYFVRRQPVRPDPHQCERAQRPPWRARPPERSRLRARLRCHFVRRWAITTGNAATARAAPAQHLVRPLKRITAPACLRGVERRTMRRATRRYMSAPLKARTTYFHAVLEVARARK